MLDESGLSKGFLGDCLASLVHGWNRCPTEAVKNATPMSYGMGASLMSLTFKFEAVLPMCMCRRTRGNL